MRKNGVWFWKNPDTGTIYKYLVGVYPLNTNWIRVSSAEYAERLEYMRKKYLSK